LFFLFLLISLSSAKETIDQMQKDTDKAAASELRLQKILIHNGIGIYATWTTVASLLNINIALQYIGRYDAETTSLVCCSCLLTILIVWFVLENTLLDKYVRYLVSQYPVVIFATSGILDKQKAKNDDPSPSSAVPESVSILTWIVLAVATTLLVARLALVAYRYRTQPLYGGGRSPSTTTTGPPAEDYEAESQVGKSAMNATY